MDNLSAAEQVGSKSGLSRLSGKGQVSIETQKPDSAGESEKTHELKNLEFKMEEADHAFALMTEIRQKLEKAYEDLSKAD